MSHTKFLLSLACMAAGLLSCNRTHAQDKIYTADGKLVEGRIIDKGPTYIRIMLKDNPGGRAQIFYPSRVDSIIHEDGSRETPAQAYKKYVRENIPQLNSWILDTWSPFFLNVSQCYERRLKNGWVGFRVPLYIGFKGGQIAGVAAIPNAQGPLSPIIGRKGFAIATGLNPRVYLFRRRVVRAFVGPEADIGYSKAKYTLIAVRGNNVYESYAPLALSRSGTFALTGKAGIMINPIDKLNITFDGGAGGGQMFGGLEQAGWVKVWCIGASIGTNF